VLRKALRFPCAVVIMSWAIARTKCERKKNNLAKVKNYAARLPRPELLDRDFELVRDE
jgi:hypothetical protein